MSQTTVTDDTSVEYLDISLSTLELLMRNGIRTVGDINAIAVPGLLRLGNFGRKRLNELKEACGTIAELPQPNPLMDATDSALLAEVARRMQR